MKKLLLSSCFLLLIGCAVIVPTKLGGPGFGGIGSITPAKLSGPGFGGIGSTLHSRDRRDASIPRPGGFNHMMHHAISDSPDIVKNVLSFKKVSSKSYQLLSTRISLSSHPKNRKHGVGPNSYSDELCGGGEPIGSFVSRTYSDGLNIDVQLCYDRFSQYNYTAVDGWDSHYNGWADGWIETWRLSGPDGGATHDAAKVEFKSWDQTLYDNGVWSPDNLARGCFVPAFQDSWTCTDYH